MTDSYIWLTCTDVCVTIIELLLTRTSYIAWPCRRIVTYCLTSAWLPPGFTLSYKVGVSREESATDLISMMEDWYHLIGRRDVRCHSDSHGSCWVIRIIIDRVTPDSIGRQHAVVVRCLLMYKHRWASRWWGYHRRIHRVSIHMSWIRIPHDPWRHRVRTWRVVRHVSYWRDFCLVQCAAGDNSSDFRIRARKYFDVSLAHVVLV